MTIFSNGGPPITADNANQWVTAIDTLTTLRGTIGTVTSAGVPQQINLGGYTSAGDGGQGTFYWNATSVAADDGGVTTVVPSGSVIGAWIRIVPTGIGTFRLGQGSGINVPTTTITTIASITLPATGIWLLLGNFSTVITAGTNITLIEGGVSTTGTSFDQPVTQVAAYAGGLATPSVVGSLLAGKVISLLVEVIFTGGTGVSVTGSVTAVLLGH